MAPALAEILLLLACPGCRGSLHSVTSPGEAPESIVCRACGRVYPVRDGIPILVVEEAGSFEGTVRGET